MLTNCVKFRGGGVLTLEKTQRPAVLFRGMFKVDRCHAVIYCHVTNDTKTQWIKTTTSVLCLMILWVKTVGRTQRGDSLLHVALIVVTSVGFWQTDGPTYEGKPAVRVPDTSYTSVNLSSKSQ